MQHYAGERLSVPDSGCNSGLNKVDLDEPSVLGEGYFELTYDTCSSAGTLSANIGTSIAEAPATGQTPEDCADAIRRSPLDGRAAAAPGLVLCVETSAEDAQELGISQRIAVVAVTRIAEDGTLALVASAWDVPA